MMNMPRIATLACGLIVLPALGEPSAVRASELMTACSADIASQCKGVSEGRGRISACLYGHDDKLSPACKPEVAKVTTGSMFKRMIPAGIRNLNNTPYEAELRNACNSDIKSLCSTVAAGDDRLLACLYAFGHKVSQTCRSEAKTVLEHLK
ncbi:MAG: cysteine rich repeat-containing protein [Alphaproteobacteria bacterium]|nr:cysteine rich repeat-containing protein [Alphaproteobacteria bacterium]